jgi:hypothetical protein
LPLPLDINLRIEFIPRLFWEFANLPRSDAKYPLPSSGRQYSARS